MRVLVATPSGHVEHTTTVVRYLSLDWLDDLRAAMAARPELAAVADGRAVGITQVVTDGPEGEVTYHLSVADGTAELGPGPADPEHVRLVQGWDTAVAVATGQLNAQEAFLTGRVRLHGDPAKLTEAMPVFAALDPVFAAMRARTRYD